MANENGLHNIILENRKKILLTGVLDVLGFDESSITAVTELGNLTVRGSELKMGNFNADRGELSAEGNIAAIVYTAKQSGSFFGRLFG